MVAAWAEPWRSAVSHSVALSTALLFVHLSALMCAGGFSLVADYALLRAPTAGDLATDTRRFASRALSVVAASGVALFLSDVSAFADLPTFWIKMVLVGLLLVNARGAMRSGRSAARDLRRCRRHARASVALWFCTLALGTMLMSG